MLVIHCVRLPSGLAAAASVVIVASCSRWGFELLSALEKKRQKETTPFGVNLTRSQVLYRAAQGPQCIIYCLTITAAIVKPSSADRSSKARCTAISGGDSKLRCKGPRIQSIRSLSKICVYIQEVLKNTHIGTTLSDIEQTVAKTAELMTYSYQIPCAQGHHP